MNLLNKDKIIQMLGLATRARKVTLGTDAFLIGISKIKLVFISSDASENTKEKVKNKCEYYKIKYTESLSTTELFKARRKSARQRVFCDLCRFSSAGWQCRYVVVRHLPRCAAYGC